MNWLKYYWRRLLSIFGFRPKLEEHDIALLMLLIANGDGCEEEEGIYIFKNLKDINGKELRIANSNHSAMKFYAKQQAKINQELAKILANGS